MSQNYNTIPKVLIQPPKIIAFGASTGGLAALGEILGNLKGRTIDLPIVIAQHMPDSFDNSFCETITEQSGIPCHLGEESMPLQDGHIYIAPANKHMVLTGDNKNPKISLTDGAPINSCKPSVDPLFSSIANIYGKNCLAIILTGLGNDGLNGAKEIVEQNGTLIAQNKQSSVVWGMPKEVAEAGICTDILPLSEIANFILEYSFGKVR